MSEPTAYGVIPARVASTRLPRKLLLNQTGKPLIQYAWENASAAATLHDVLIATDSEEIAQVAQDFGARVAMTGDHPSGSDRIAEVVRRELVDADLIVNIQGDEPEADPGTIDRLARSLADRTGAEMATLASPIQNEAVLEDRSCVKVVCAATDGPCIFRGSRFPTTRTVAGREFWQSPGDEGGAYTESPWLLHMGLYAYRRGIPAGADRDAAVEAGASGKPGTVARPGSGGLDSRGGCPPSVGWHRHGR